MKKTLLIAALTMMSAPALASKARKAALQNAKTTATDVQDIFLEPSKMWDLSDYATIEFGSTGTTYSYTTVNAATENSPNAEGGFMRTHDNMKWGAYMGHQSEDLNYMLGGGSIGTGMTAGKGLRKLENPLNLFFGMKMGDMNLGANLFYAASERKSAGSATGASSNPKKSATGVAVGVSADKWNANAVVGLGAKVSNEIVGTTSNEEFKASANFRVAGEFALNDMIYLYGNVAQLGGKHTAQNTTTEDSDLDIQKWQLGLESKIKGEAAHFYYGAMLNSMTEKNKANNVQLEKLEVMTLPVYFGLEADAASWLVLRASLVQNVLLNSKKITTTSTYTANPSNSDADNTDSTVAAFGAGFKFGKLLLDGTMAAGTSGALNASTFMTSTSLTYMF